MQFWMPFAPEKEHHKEREAGSSIKNREPHQHNKVEKLDLVVVVIIDTKWLNGISISQEVLLKKYQPGINYDLSWKETSHKKEKKREHDIYMDSNKTNPIFLVMHGKNPEQDDSGRWAKRPIKYKLVKQAEQKSDHYHFAFLQNFHGSQILKWENK